jgi:hypothetical protein
MHGVLDKLNRENDRRFKDILKEQASSLDQCFMIFDSHTKSIFSNYDKTKWKTVLKSIEHCLNFDSLENSLTPLWSEIFHVKKGVNFHIKHETAKNLYYIIDYLSENMISFKKEKFKKLIDRFTE